MRAVSHMTCKIQSVPRQYISSKAGLVLESREPSSDIQSETSTQCMMHWQELSISCVDIVACGFDTTGSLHCMC